MIDEKDFPGMNDSEIKKKKRNTEFELEIRRILESTANRIEARSATIWYQHGQQVCCIYSMEEELEGFEQPASIGIVGKILETGEPYLTMSCSKDPVMSSRVLDYFGYVIRNMLSVSIPVHAKPIGVIQYLDKLFPNDFTREDIEIVQHAAEQLGVLMLDSSNQIHLQNRIVELQKKWKAIASFSEIIGSSPVMQKTLQQAWIAAQNDFPLLLVGETGTGKEIFARSIHQRSRRAGKPFIAENCGAIAENIAESELFGHIRGSFTGATGDRKGLIESADGGTLFLDEVGEIPPSLQIRLLRFMQEGRIRRVGDSQERPVDTRLITATHRDLSTLIHEGIFRQDYFFRIRVFQIDLPPLRERGNDIVLLTRHFVNQENAKRKKEKPLTIDASVYEFLRRYSFPGNIRELQNAVIVAYAYAEEEGVMLPEHFSETTIRLSTESTPAPSQTPTGFDPLIPLEELEKNYIQHVLAHTQGRKGDAAQILGIHPNTLTRKLKEYGIA